MHFLIMAASAQSAATLLITLLMLYCQTQGSYSTTITTVNECSSTVWPDISSGAGTSPLSTTGFSLQPGESNAIVVPSLWSGRLWGRTLCSEDSTGNFSCITGDCTSSPVECSGSSATPLATLAEFTLNGNGGFDFFDISLTNGYNLPMTVEPQGGNCTATGCLLDLNLACPNELKVMNGRENVACKSPCQAFGDESQNCCGGDYGKPETCKPSFYSEFFKSACPRAIVDGTKNFRRACSSAEYYRIIFCPTPSPSSIKPAGRNKYPKTVDNSGGQVYGSTNNIGTVILYIVSIIFGGFIAFKITIFCFRDKRNCSCKVVAETELQPPSSGGA